MGTSTNAILYFGFDFCDVDEGDALPWGEDEDEYEAVSKKFGSDRSNCACIIDRHCYIDSPIFFVALKRNVFTAYRGMPSTVDIGELKVSEEEIQQLRSFCETMGIAWQEPKWRLASYWG
jgi:hypothetical protein